MSLRNEIVEQFIQVAEDQGKVPPVLADELILLDANLDSLCFAIIVSRLEDKLGIDPFSSADELTFPTTFGEFIALYERAA